MDIDFLRTFLEVNKTRHFGKASAHLFVTQSTISSRIRQLEEDLGTILFTRTRNDIQLTTAGKKLLPQAENIVNQWEETKKSILHSEKEVITLNIGSVSGIWDIFLQDWLLEIRKALPELLFKGESLNSLSQVKGLLSRVLDIGFMFEPPKIGDLVCQEIAEVEVCLVSTEPNISVIDAVSNNYIYVEWGTTFSVEHSRWFPNIPVPRLSLDLGRWAVDYLLNAGGSAYLSKSMIEKYLRDGTLYLVKDAPVFKRVAHGVFNRKSCNLKHIQECLQILFKRQKNLPRPLDVPEN